MTKKSVSGPSLVAMDKTVCERVRFISLEDHEQLFEAIEASRARVVGLIEAVQTERIKESSNPERVHLSNEATKMLAKEAQKLERLVIVEAVSAQSFFAVQKHFRSMVRAANVIIMWMKGSALAQRLDTLRTEGIELLNDLYEHIKELEGNEYSRLPGVDQHVLRGDSLTGKQRDRFVKVFSDFAVLFRGTMALADMFSNDPASVGGYNDIQSVFASIEREGQASEPLTSALGYVDHYAADVNKQSKGFFGKFRGQTSVFKNACAKAINAKSPTFGKLVDVNAFVEFLMTKSMEQLLAIFGRFNDYVANDIDIDWLLNVTKTPRTLGSLFKSVFDAFSGGSLRGAGIGGGSR